MKIQWIVFGERRDRERRTRSVRGSIRMRSSLDRPMLRVRMGSGSGHGFAMAAGPRPVAPNASGLQAHGKATVPKSV